MNYAVETNSDQILSSTDTRGELHLLYKYQGKHSATVKPVSGLLNWSTGVPDMTENS